ncbi:hypothetical protein, partial [Bacillus paranthracis]|uniref:hypothetical protein n=2 Tax=Bacillus cereus group TaxID=86661 RepID=UPI00240D6638
MSLADRFKKEMTNENLLRQVELMMTTLQNNSKEQSERLIEQNKMVIGLVNQLTELMIDQQKSMELMLNRIDLLEKENSSKLKIEKKLEEESNARKQENAISETLNADSVEVNKPMIKKVLPMVRDEEEIKLI